MYNNGNIGGTEVHALIDYIIINRGVCNRVWAIAASKL